MKTLQFKCTLKTDVILNSKAATEGNNMTLDFIPGNNFLGIVARHYGEFSEAEQLEIFHSGKVRFGDAHPVVVQHEGIRSVRIPLSMYYPKLKSIEDESYIHHFYKEGEEHPQLKQCRNGFYIFSDNKGFTSKAKRSFAIKSAYDREKRRSEDEKMYGYESLNAGQSYLFEVECDNEEIAERLRSMLPGTHHIGRSRTAQYGLVEIEQFDFQTQKGNTRPFEIDGKNYIAVYADSRLIFLDQNGDGTTCTFQPTLAQLGINDEQATIDWTKSQVRTFQYAPWNSKRGTRDADRCGIEKGSVFIIQTDAPTSTETTYVGTFRNEGFGKVIYNPEFLQKEEGTNGSSRFKIQKAIDADSIKHKDISCNTSLLQFLKTRQQAEKEDKTIFENVNKFVTEYEKYFKGERFASQWGTIRSIAMQETDPKELSKKIFGQDILDPASEENPDEGYLTHGTAKDKWVETGRLMKLKDFAMENKQYLRKAMINLASEMAKICTKQ